MLPLVRREGWSAVGAALPEGFAADPLAVPVASLASATAPSGGRWA
jgi:hypothetical protein